MWTSEIGRSRIFDGVPVAASLRGHNYISASPTARPYPRNGHAVGDADIEPI